MRIEFYGAKGGVGTTTVAAAMAIAEQGTLVSPDAAPIVGAPDDGTGVIALGQAPVTVEDCGILTLANNPSGQIPAVLVTNACYLALRAALAAGVENFAGIVLVHEKGRSLNAQDIEAVLGLPVLAVVDRDPAIARAIDAGLLATRLPRKLATVADELGPVVPLPA
jgi:hypothetical protein